MDDRALLVNRNRFALFFEETETGGNKYEKNLNLWQICVKIYHLFLQHKSILYISGEKWTNY